MKVEADPKLGFRRLMANTAWDENMPWQGSSGAWHGRGAPWRLRHATLFVMIAGFPVIGWVARCFSRARLPLREPKAAFMSA